MVDTHGHIGHLIPGRCRREGSVSIEAMRLHGGILASRSSTCPRDHLCRSTTAPRIVADEMKRVLTNIDTDHAGRDPGLLRHRSAPRLWHRLASCFKY